ncbi:efflux transporter outer membrane subunit [Roseibacillus ishigakijimensis]|uniref:Efflux transporter outer membrane subunit n=1 Tax=Roseibacillus ishigakijimensis TaxID=454146 RepID=A0A934RNS5_9BACT|nr:efflux transporter outer membrane subunit [Roseibacillus ishigakijimensis]MBK1832781.1 efflux transporter outer membrane subunit [Roseibacillus ishigakijimensis]
MSRPLPALAISLTTLLALGSCTTVGPDYHKPTDNLPEAFKNANWPAAPAPGDPYAAFRDSELNRLLHVAEKNNQDLAAALARIDQSRAVLGLSKADQTPTLVGDFAGAHQLDSRNTNMPSGGAYRDYDARLTLNYEVDLWGRIRRQVQQAEANLQASEADYQAALLSLKGEVARNYLTLRSLDREMALLKQTADLRQQRLSLFQSRQKTGTSSGLDVARAETEYQSTQAEIARLAQRRGELENALAALTGEAASTFTLATRVSDGHIPSIPGAVPSDLLRRRPDIVAAERRLAASNEGVGLAIATYLPRLTLTGTGGTSALDASDLFDPASVFYSAGAGLFTPIIQGGRVKADREQAEARFREALANYRQVMLEAIRDTENALLGTRTLEQALASQRKAAEASQRTARLVRVRYDGGLDSLFEVTETERQTLEQERLLTQTELARQLAAVNLIQALGGEWKAAK